jgi:hypothetical protein
MTTAWFNVDVYGDVQIPGAPPLPRPAKFPDPDLLSVSEAGGEADLVGVLLVDDLAGPLARGAGARRLLVFSGAHAGHPGGR